jgi:hypothetical protein
MVFVTHLHNGPTVLQSHGNALLVLESHAPHGIALRNQLANKLASLQIPNLDPTVTTAADDPGIVELEACDAVVVSREPVDGAGPLDGPDPHGTITAAGDKSVSAHLQLPDQRRVALQNGLAFTLIRVSRNPLPSLNSDERLTLCERSIS